MYTLRVPYPPADVDFGRRSTDYATHRPGFPPSFYERLDAVCPLRGARALDVGTGPGHVAVALAQRGVTVTGIDISDEQIRHARLRAEAANMSDRCEFHVRPVEHTKFREAQFDLVTAGQCWGWFDEQQATTELRRVLRPGGHLVVAQFSYLPNHSAIARRTEQLIHEFNPTWALRNHDGQYPQHIDALIAGGFVFVEQFSYDLLAARLAAAIEELPGRK